MFTSKPDNFNDFKKYLTNEKILYYVDNRTTTAETLTDNYLNSLNNRLNTYKKDENNKLRSQNFNILKKCIENVKSTS